MRSWEKEERGNLLYRQSFLWSDSAAIQEREKEHPAVPRPHALHGIQRGSRRPRLCGKRGGDSLLKIRHFRHHKKGGQRDEKKSKNAFKEEHYD